MVQLSEVQERKLTIVDQHGRVTSSLVARTLKLPGRTVRYHLDVLIQNGLLEPIGEKRGRAYRRSSEKPRALAGRDSRNAAILAAILEQGGRIEEVALRELVLRHGSEPRMVGTLHGRRLAHLRREPIGVKQRIYRLRWALAGTRKQSIHPRRVRQAR